MTVLPYPYGFGGVIRPQANFETIKVIFLQRDREDVRVQSCPQFFL